MPSFAQIERAALCDVLGDLGPEAPTLCAGWTTYDMAAHLVLRERRPVSALGIVVPPLAPLTEQTMSGLKSRYAYPALVRMVRDGPPRWSPYRSPRLESANAVELFVHHEDVRRAQPGWTRRQLPFAVERAMWKRLRAIGRPLVRRSPVGLEAVRTDSPDSVRLKEGDTSVVMRGLPSELLLFCFGRGQAAEVERDGAPEVVERLDGARLGV